MSDGSTQINLDSEPSTAAQDFTGDGQSDILYQAANGDTSLWLTGSGGTFTPVDIGVIPSSWTIQAMGDFNGDGKADILWRNADGQVDDWMSHH